jgi:protocatechuate 3,4-dioxygenase beta subunit
LDNTFHRGIQQSDADGVVTFETLFPGHYTGRAVSLILDSC